MKFFCPIALRDWFINLCDWILRAGEQALDHYWPCGKCVFPPTRRFATSQGKCLREGYGTSNEPRPTCLASSICLFVFFFITASYLLYHERRNARAEVLILTAHSQAFAWLSVFSSLLSWRLLSALINLVMFTSCNVEFFPFGELI